jgi:hypothetical protein
MNPTIKTLRRSRNRPAASPLDVERNRMRALPAVRFLAGRFALPVATAVLTAEACGLYTGGDR